MQRQRSGARDNQDLLINVVGGIAGGLVASCAMEWFQRALGKFSPDLGGVPGAGGQQYRRPQSEPATYAAADRLAEATTGQPVPPASKPLAASAIHYAFGGAVGAIYGAAAARTPDITTGGGLPFGASVWLMADELGMPLMGLAKSPEQYPVSDHAVTFASHLLFGATTEAVRRMVVASLRR
jgi:putative membrane protein